MWDAYCENLRFAIPGTTLYNQFLAHGCDANRIQQAGPGLPAPAPAPAALDPMCDAGKRASLLPLTDPQFQNYFGTQARIQSYIAQCGQIALPPGAGQGVPPSVVIPDPNPPIRPITIPTPAPPIVPITEPVTPGGPTCIGANYTVNAQGECVYPAGGPSINMTPPLTLTVPNPQPTWTPLPTTCPDGSQPLLDGSCPVVMTPQAPPSVLTTLEGYLTNPVVLIGAAVVIYLATRKKRRAHR